MRIGFKISGLLTIFFLVMSSFAVLATSPNTFYKMQDTQTIVLNPIADSWVDELESTQNYGSDWYLMVGLEEYEIRKRSLLHFDISALPDNITIDSAELKLNLT
ncbi:MAG: DNRLRE domain-containing protein, partial [Candidatus Methanofastidiosia archaeon]